MSWVVAGLLALRVRASFVEGGDAHSLPLSLSLSLSFPLSRHDAHSLRLIAHHHSRALSFSLSQSMAMLEVSMAGTWWHWG